MRICEECQVPTGREQAQCPNCGAVIAARRSKKPWSRESFSPAAKVFTGIFVVWGLVFPFLLPIILKISHAQM